MINRYQWSLIITSYNHWRYQYGIPEIQRRELYFVEENNKTVHKFIKGRDKTPVFFVKFMTDTWLFGCLPRSLDEAG